MGYSMLGSKRRVVTIGAFADRSVMLVPYVEAAMDGLKSDERFWEKRRWDISN